MDQHRQPAVLTLTVQKKHTPSHIVRRQDSSPHAFDPKPWAVHCKVTNCFRKFGAFVIVCDRFQKVRCVTVVT